MHLLISNLFLYFEFKTLDAGFSSKNYCMSSTQILYVHLKYCMSTESLLYVQIRNFGSGLLESCMIFEQAVFTVIKNTTILVCDGRKIRQLIWVPCKGTGQKIKICGPITSTCGLPMQDISNQPHSCICRGIRYKRRA